MAKITRAEAKRRAFLCNLARHPGRALGAWKQLKGNERAFVLLEIAFLYGRLFAKQFMAIASRFKGKVPAVEMTNIPQRGLSKKGYKLARVLSGTLGKTHIWVHPSGREIWVFPRIKSPEKPPPPNPDRITIPDYPERVYGRLTRSVKNPKGFPHNSVSKEYNDGTIVVYLPNGDRITYRPQPGDYRREPGATNAYDIYDSKGKKELEFTMAINSDDMFKQSAK